ncbi:MAG: ArnT family glycosyltransferase [Gemmatimonadota bacterium]
MRKPKLNARTLGGVLLLATVALAVRLWGLGHAPHYDELFHVLAARSWLADGSFCIADCLAPYDRGAFFTLLVAGSFSLLGESLEAARVPSVVAGVLLVLAVFAWLRAEVSARAAWTAAGLCALAPELIGWSQVARFYALQALFVWVGVALFYVGVTRSELRRGLRAAAVVGGVACLALSRQLQVTTLIPVAALGLWFLGWLFARRDRVSRRVRVSLYAAGAVIVLAGLAWQFGTLEHYWEMYRQETNLIRRPDADNPFFYHAWFAWMYSFLYALFPIAILVAFVAARRVTVLLGTIFTVSFVAHSFGAFKADRMILYALPFFLSVWGIAFADLVPRLAAWVREGLARAERFAGETGTGRTTSSGPAAVVLVTAALLFAALNTEALQATIRLLTVSGSEWSGEPWYRGHTDWEALEPTLEPLVDDADVVVSSAVLKTLYVFDRTGVSLSRTQLFDPGPVDRGEEEFWRDWRHGRPVISTPESIERLVACYESGLILVENGHWRRSAVVPPATADAIEGLTNPVPLPRGARARAFVWRSASEALPAGTDCPSDPVLRR